MHLSDADLRDLAAFLARRMTTDFAPVDSTDTLPQGSPAVDAWMAVLVEARDGGWLPTLVARITAARPYDATLREAASLLVPRRASPELRVAGLLFAAGAVGMGTMAAGGMVVAAALVTAEALQEPSPRELANANVAHQTFEADSSQSASHTTTREPGKVISAASTAEGLSLVRDGSYDAKAKDAAPADQDGDPVAVSADHREEDGPPDGISEPSIVKLVPRGGPHFPSGKCGGLPGEAVGYWYAGRHTPGVLGDSIVLDRMVNVRAEYPHEGNRWNTRARIRCVLEPGDVAHIGSEPIRIEGGHIWVPVRAGDIRSSPTDGTAMVDDGG